MVAASEVGGAGPDDGVAVANSDAVDNSVAVPGVADIVAVREWKGAERGNGAAVGNIVAGSEERRAGPVDDAAVANHALSEVEGDGSHAQGGDSLGETRAVPDSSRDSWAKVKKDLAEQDDDADIV